VTGVLVMAGFYVIAGIGLAVGYGIGMSWIVNPCRKLFAWLVIQAKKGWNWLFVAPSVSTTGLLDAVYQLEYAAPGDPTDPKE